MPIRIVLVVLGLAAVSAAPAAAQAPHGVGVTMGYPGGLGVLWHVGSRLALRPEVGLSRASTTTTTTTTFPSLFGAVTPPMTTSTTQTDWTTTVGLSALVTLGDIDRLRLYAVPRVSWFTSSSKTSGATSIAGLASDNDGLQASGAFGAHYGLHERFAVFGELGVQYTRQTLSSSFTTSQSSARVTTTGIRSAVGVVVYF
jgi:hypothetical protein